MAAKAKSNQVISSMAKRQQAFIKKLDTRLKLYGSGMFALPINRPVESVSILCRADDENFTCFKDDKAPCRLLCRVTGLDEEGLSMHLTEMARVFQWILWQPLLANSKTHPERCWREETYGSPAEFLVDMVSESQQPKLIQLCADRWDTNMMLGGNTEVVKLIKSHIKRSNEALKTSIMDWMRDLKWHQEWDWEKLAETAFFTRSGNYDVYWESAEYDVPSRFAEHPVWKRGDRTGVIDNLLKILPKSEFSVLEEDKQEISPRSHGGLKQSGIKSFFNVKRGSARRASAKKSKVAKGPKRRAKSTGRTLRRKGRKRLSRSASKRRSVGRSKSRRRSVSKKRRSVSKKRRSVSKKRRSVSKKRRGARRSASKSKKRRSTSKPKKRSSKSKKNKSKSKSKSTSRSRTPRKKSKSRSRSITRRKRSRARSRSVSRKRRRVSRSKSRSSSKSRRRSRSAVRKTRHRSKSKH